MTHRNFGNPMDAARFAEASEHLALPDARHPVALIDILVIGGAILAGLASFAALIWEGCPC